MMGGSEMFFYYALWPLVALLALIFVASFLPAVWAIRELRRNHRRKH